jgi:hypothetical protein
MSAHVCAFVPLCAFVCLCGCVPMCACVRACVLSVLYVHCSNRLKPGDAGFNYDVRVDFHDPLEDNEWDGAMTPPPQHTTTTVHTT